MIDPNNIINKMLGTKPKKDCKSKNKNKQTNYCDFCGKKKEGHYMGYQGEMSFICNDCDEYKNNTPDFNL